MQANRLEEVLMTLSWIRTTMLATTVLSVLAIVGCGGAGTKGPSAAESTTPVSDASCSVAENWCGEHGVPEDICAQCDAKLAAEYKQKGDWCNEHNRPESQCFLCNPKLQAKFADEYEARYGKKPPKPTGT
jgi:hypothetical protein